MALQYQKNEKFYDELFQAGNQPHLPAQPLVEKINSFSIRELRRMQKAAEQTFFQQGVTFNVYHNKKGTEKILPFDIIPRIITAQEWQSLEGGIKQRVHALNLFLNDIYGAQKIIKDGIIPADIVLQSTSYNPICQHLNPARAIWNHINGIDLVRDGAGRFCVLEDNVRCPSGISYVLESREVQKRIFSQAFSEMRIRPISDYGDHLFQMLRHVTPVNGNHDNPLIIVLTPGSYNSAYYEHTFLAQQMGVVLAEGSDLVVVDDKVMLKTTRGLQRVDVIYRRIDDEFIDPQAFRKDSLLGVPGIIESYRKGNVTLVNAPGTGIADDKAVYAYVPDMIKYYLGEDAIIPNVQTYLCSDPVQCDYVLKNMEKLVIKTVNLSGGYGMLIGTKSTARQREEFANFIKAAPRNYIAQPILDLSCTPTISGSTIEGRHVDFRPYVLNGEDIFVLPGGLTRVAMVKDSLVVNSSQGGGSKDTWVLEQ